MTTPDSDEWYEWWARNHPWDWWAKELGVPVNHQIRLLVWDLVRRAYHREERESCRGVQAGLK